MDQDRLSRMCQWFDQWDECGQVVALLKMLTRIPPIQAKFLAISLECSLMDCAELALREQEANNPGYISNLLNETKERAMEELLLHLPLLRPGNKEAKHSYLGVIPVLLNYCLENNQLLDKATQLLVYTLFHPALKEDKRTFEHWRKSLGEKIMNIGVPTVSTSESTQGKIRRSNSLTPPFAVTPSNELWQSQDDLSVVQKASSTSRRFSLSLCEGPPLSPQSSQTSSGSGSETHLEDLQPAYEAVGMRDVKPWLKTLRLHKYSRLFSQLTYTQMLNLSEETFDMTVESVGAGPVTQGAQRKILLSISKLKDRYNVLCNLEREINAGGGKNLLSAMDEVKAILLTPIKPYEEGDQPPVDNLPSQLMKVLNRIFTLLQVCSSIMNEEALTTFLSLLETALQLDAFTHQQKLKMSQWGYEVSQKRKELQQKQYGLLLVPPVRLPVSHPLLHTHTQSFLAKRPSLQDNPSEVGSLDEFGHSYVQRTYSAPPNPPPDQSSDTDLDLNSRLESLCLSMTEHSLEL